jgi:hypothetical protein
LIHCLFERLRWSDDAENRGSFVFIEMHGVLSAE